jgi:two-component system alkaline phosphatase synthesis response regulator PhoP
MAKVLVVEDEELARVTLARYLSTQYDVVSARTGEEGFALALQDPPDVIVLDITLPGVDGITVCRQLRERGLDMPILFLTARGEEIDKLTGFGVGGDDYITKPASLLELDARIRVALRRRPQPSTPSMSGHEFTFSDVVVDFSTHEVTVEGEPIELSFKEFELLRYFIEHRNTAVSREALLNDVWDYSEGVSSRTIDTHVMNLRRKLGGSKDRSSAIKTVRGVGYRFIPEGSKDERGRGPQPK